MRSKLLIVTMSLLGLAAATANAKGCCKEIAIAISAIQQATQADVVVVGRVTDLEGDLTMIEQYPGSGAVGHMIANVRIEEALFGVRGLTHVRVGFVPGNRFAIGEGQFALQGNGVRSWTGAMNLVAGQEACFFLQKHPTADFFVMMQYAYPLNKSDLGYETQMKGVRNVVNAFSKPVDSLQAKEASDRQLAACALILRYRTQRPSSVPVTVANEPVSAEESKLILNVLSEMKWGEQPFDPNGTFSLQNVFHQLGLSANDGWVQPPQNPNQDVNAAMTEAVSKWCKSKQDTHRIQRLVTKPQLANAPTTK